MTRIVPLLLAGVISAMQCRAQSGDIKAITSAQVAELQKSLRVQAKNSGGTASGSMLQYPAYYSMLIYRDQKGEVEIHQKFDEIMIVIDGKATLATGGTPLNPRVLKPGELRAASTEGGSSSVLKKGNIINIPANTPHQVFVPAGGSVTYIDVKIAHVTL